MLLVSLLRYMQGSKPQAAPSFIQLMVAKSLLQSSTTLPFTTCPVLVSHFSDSVRSHETSKLSTIPTGAIAVLTPPPGIQILPSRATAPAPCLGSSIGGKEDHVSAKVS